MVFSFNVSNRREKKRRTSSHLCKYKSFCFIYKFTAVCQSNGNFLVFELCSLSIGIECKYDGVNRWAKPSPLKFIVIIFLSRMDTVQGKVIMSD